jgi:transcription antitermination factor NusA-like protein
VTQKEIDTALDVIAEREGVNAIWGSELTGYTVDVESQEIADALRAELGEMIGGYALDFNVMTEAQYEKLGAAFAAMRSPT